MNKQKTHNDLAPYWAVGLIIFGGTGLSTLWFNLGIFWNSYVLDMMGPAWNYILFRGLYTEYAENRWTRFFTPNTTLIIFLLVCLGIELSQFFNLYESTYDSWDFLAYISILLPIFIIDSYFSR